MLLCRAAYSVQKMALSMGDEGWSCHARDICFTFALNL
ncbi:unnamed protein product, partial [Plutella xylostella]